jgi:hypothetical protein
MKLMRILPAAAGAGLLVLAGVSGASAQEGEAMKSILGAIGIIPKERAPINYRERAPLVLPPKMDLPAPKSREAIESRVANWPKDPDTEAARTDAREARLPETQRQSYKVHEGHRLSIEEIRAGRRAGGQAAPVDYASQDNRADKSRMSPDELRAFSSSSQPKLDPHGLDRRYLSDPPQEFLRAAGGGTLKATMDPKPMGDPDSPGAFNRERAQQFQ